MLKQVFNPIKEYGVVAIKACIINPSSNMTKINGPFISYSGTNLKNMPLKDALQSKMLRTIRESRGELKEIQGCALWEKRDWVQSLTKPATSASEK